MMVAYWLHEFAVCPTFMLFRRLRHGPKGLYVCINAKFLVIEASKDGNNSQRRFNHKPASQWPTTHISQALYSISKYIIDLLARLFVTLKV